MSPQVTIIVPYYRQPKMLRKQLDTWASYSQDVYEFFEYIIVDDGSPEPAQAVVEEFKNSLPKYRDPRRGHLYRIDKDVPWNRSMARNLGTIQAPTEWIIHLDTDHVLPPESAERLRFWFEEGNEPPAPRNWYRFQRCRVGAADETRRKDKADPKAQFVDIHPHIDSYLCSRVAYWRAGGYNEDFTGVLGGGSPFLKEMEAVNGIPGMLGTPLHVYTRHAIPDSSEHTLKRDDGTAFKNRKAEIMKTFGSLRGRGQKAALRLPWHRVF